MNELHQGPQPFPPTPRQAWIFSVTLTGLALASTLQVSWVFLLLIFPWILGITVMIFDREGPVRNWLGPVIHSVFYPLALVRYNAIVVQEWMKTGSFPQPAIVVFVNAALLGTFLLFVHYLWPRRCPVCKDNKLLPLVPLVFREPRSNSTRWCASCGKQFWKSHGLWEPERRTTWWDYAQRQRPAPNFASHGSATSETV
jgi:hypothetical protein